MLCVYPPHTEGDVDMTRRIDSIVAVQATIDSLEKKLKEESTDKKTEDTSSRPPSPPESGTTTPRLTIAPCPARFRELIPPPNYGTVDVHTIYRSSFPQDRNIDFVKTLKIKSVLTLVDTDPCPSFQNWIINDKITHLKVNIATNKDGAVNTTLHSLCQALMFATKRSNQPVYIHCNQGKHRTGCVVGCLRKMQGLPMDEILDEYYTYAGKKAREGDVELIRKFEPSEMFQCAFVNGIRV